MTQFTAALLRWSVFMAALALCCYGLIRYSRSLIGLEEGRRFAEMAATAENSGALRTAIANYEKAVAFSPRNLDFRLRLAPLYQRSGRLDEARTLIRKGLAFAGPDTRSHAQVMLGRLDLEAGRWQDARAAFEDALRASPGCAEAHYGLAKTAELTDDYPNMITALAQLADTDADACSTEYRAERERHEQGAALLARQLDQGNGTPSLLYRLGMAYKETGQWSRATATFARAAGAENAPGDAYFWLGVEAETTGDLDGATARYQQAIAICPNHLRALKRLQFLLEEAGKEGQPSRPPQ